MSEVLADRPPLEGAFNTNEFVLGPDGSTFLRRIPRDNLVVMDFIRAEHAFLGFRDIGGNFKRRTPGEQLGFSNRAASHGLRVLPAVYIDDKGYVYYPFLKDIQTLDEHLSSASVDQAQVTIHQLFSDIVEAHKQGIIYGDRWSENILITPDRGLIHIDFDLEIFGNGARELELAQLVFYSVCGGRDKVMPLISQILANTKDYNMARVRQFATRLAEQFRMLNHPTYGNGEWDTNTVFEMMNALKSQDMRARYN